MKYVAFENLYVAKAVAHREALEAGEKGKLYLDDVKVKTADGDKFYIEVSDDYVFIQQKLKDKEKHTLEEALADPVEKVKPAKSKAK